MADGYNVAGGALSGGASGAMIGSAIAPGVGTVVGGVVGAIAGGILGGKKKKFKEPARASGAVYGYDTYGNLVNKGTYAYNSSTGKYELRAGELNSAEKAMRANLAGNIANLINTVGTTPNAFVRYAKELSDSYYKQAERKLAENVATEQARLDESMARRGLSTSRAAADVQSEFERRRQNTLADIYDTAQRYGLSSQLQMQEQARGALSSLGGYQQNLANVDQAYLNQAINAQQLGQAYENAKVGMANQNIALQNTSIDNLMGGISQLGSLAGYYLGSQTPATTTPNGTAVMNSLGNTNYLAGYQNQLSLGMTPNASQFNNVGGTPTGFISATYGNPGLGWV